MLVDIHDVITCATFCDDRLRGSGVARGRISRFPIDLRRRPYNTLALPCECVMATAHTTHGASTPGHPAVIVHKPNPKLISNSSLLDTAFLSLQIIYGFMIPCPTIQYHYL